MRKRGNRGGVGGLPGTPPTEERQKEKLNGGQSSFDPVRISGLLPTLMRATADAVSMYCLNDSAVMSMPLLERSSGMFSSSSNARTLGRRRKKERGRNVSHRLSP